MMSTRPVNAANGSYSHELLLHDDDATLVYATRAFVEQGLAAGGHVVVHGSRGRLELMHSRLGEHPRLAFCLDSDLFTDPTSTLFAYQRAFAEKTEPTEYWETGTLPLGADDISSGAWARYEALVNEALSDYAFHSLCTYDTRAVPASVVAAAKATHPWVCTGESRADSRDYVQPADFLENALACSPGPPARAPSVAATLYGLRELARIRGLVRRCATASCAIPREAILEFVGAVNEVVANGVVHGAPPVDVTLWVELTSMTCQVDDSGPGLTDALVGYRYPDHSGPMGLWAARQMCSELFVQNRRGGGCRVLLTLC